MSFCQHRNYDLIPVQTDDNFVCSWEKVAKWQSQIYHLMNKTLFTFVTFDKKPIFGNVYRIACDMQKKKWKNCENLGYRPLICAWCRMVQKL